MLIDQDLGPFPEASDLDLVGLDMAAGYLLAEHFIPTRMRADCLYGAAAFGVHGRCPHCRGPVKRWPVMDSTRRRIGSMSAIRVIDGL